MTLEDKPSYNGTTFDLDEREENKEGAIALEVKDCFHSIHKLQEPVLYKLTISLCDSSQNQYKIVLLLTYGEPELAPRGNKCGATAVVNPMSS